MINKKDDKGTILEKITATREPNELPSSNLEEIELFPDSSQGTAKKAVKLLIERNEGYKEPNKTERNNILIAFAKLNKVVYGKAFDIVRITSTENIDLENLSDVEKNINKIIICEVKSTTRKEIKLEFEKYFFSLTTAELLVAQSLKDHFKFIFVNIQTKEVMELTLKEVFKKAKGIYPGWSVRF